jgi:hypothetical protein
MPLLPGAKCCKEEFPEFLVCNTNIITWIEKEDDIFSSDSFDTESFDEEGDFEIANLVTDPSNINLQLGEMLELPFDLNLTSLLETWKYKNPHTQNQQQLNEDLQYLLEHNEATVEFCQSLRTVIVKEFRKKYA